MSHESHSGSKFSDDDAIILGVGLLFGFLLLRNRSTAAAASGGAAVAINGQNNQTAQTAINDQLISTGISAATGLLSDLISDF